MTDVNANIGINFDTSQALAQLRQLQAGLSRFNQTLTQGNVAAMNAQKGLNDQLMQAINATGKFVATQKDVATSTSSFTQALEKNQLSMREYFRYTAAAATANTKTFKGMFAQEREVINRARKDRVKLLQSQYIQMQAANGDMIKVLQVIPKHLKMVNGEYADYATRMQMTAQRQQFLNQLLKQGSTQLLNFGKNTQWAGRQLMVGLTIPLSILGSTAAKTFMEMEQAVIKFSRVYGDMLTNGDATDKAIADIQRLGKEFTKYGVAVKDTVEMAASAAAMGLTGDALNAQVINATKLAVLGQVEQAQALETTISLTNAFGLASEDLAQKINYLNAVENQTVLSIEDLTVAIPKAGPVVKQLGGSVEDLAFFMTAMKEGGINASEGANALKSGLASMINPSKKASEFLADLGINIKGIVEANAGDLKGTVVGFARALDTLDPLNRARAIEQMFGKFQFARLSTLFKNVTSDASQASRALGLAGASVEELAILSERELKKVEDATGTKFKKAMEDLKTQLVPIGKAFLQAATPIVTFVGKILEKFNNLGEGTKKVIAIIIGVVGGLAPIALMTFGILANGVANLIKFFAMLRGGIAKLNGANNVLGGGFDYLTNQQIENLAETNALHNSHGQLISTFNVEKSAVDALAAAYGNASSQARALAQSSPGLFNTVPGPAGAVAGLPPRKFATGGVVPGTGNKDTVPALLTPGEVVITKQTAKENPELVAALQNGSVMKYATGTGKKKRVIVKPHTGRVSGGAVETRLFSGAAIMGPGNQASGPVAGSSLAGMDSNFIGGPEGATDQFKAAMAAAMKTQMMQVDGVTAFNEKTYASYTENWSGIDDVLDSIADDFARGIGPGVSDVSQLGQNQFPLIMQHIDELEKSMKITAEQANTLRESSRKLFNPDLGTPENPGRDAVAKNRQRIETGIDDAGNEVVTRVGVERVALPGKVGSDYLDDRTKANTAREYARRGVAAPEGKITFAHIKSGEKGTDFESPIASAKDGISEAEQRIVDALTSGGKVKEGTVLVTKQIAESIEEGLEQAEKTAEVASPSKRTKRLGRDIGKGLEEGLEESIAGVKIQSERLAEASIPKTAAETQAKVDKMDLANKAFYDDINTPEMRDERQILKSQDRNRRKRGATTTVDSVSDTPVDPQSLSLTIAASKKTADATEELAVKTEEAVTAQSQVVQQIKDESRSRVKIKGNTINIGKAREDADKAENEAAITRARAAAIEKEQAKQRKSNSPTTITDEQVLEAKEKANEAELKAAETRQRLAEAEIANAEQLIEQDPVKGVKDTKKDQELIANGTQEKGDLLRRSVEGSEDAVDSTVLVAENTDELASATEDAVDAQTQNTQNLLTGAQITDATTGNMTEVLQATDQTGLAQQEFADSSENIADINEDIEKQKKIQRDRLTKMNAEEAARTAAENGTVPAGSQSNNGYINPATAMGSVEAYEEASTYTRDKKGQILFDPETGNPTTLTAKQIAQKKRGMRREKVGKYSGKAAGTLGTAAMVAGMAGAPPQVTAALGTASTVAQFAPMIAGLSGPQGVVVGIAALAAGAYLLNRHFNKMAAAAAKFATDLSATRDGLKAIGEMSGKVGASEIMDKRRSTSQYGKYDEAIKIDNTFGKKFLGSDVGKKEKKLFKENVKKFGSEKAVNDLSLKLATAVADGVLDAQAANSIVAELALQLKDQKLEMQLVGQMSTIIGPNGENLKNEPLETRALILANANNRVATAESDILQGKGNTRENVASVAAYNMNNIQMATMMADQIQVEYETQKKKLESELASTTNAAKKLEIGKQIAELDAKNLENSRLMNNQLLTQIQLQQKSFEKVYSASLFSRKEDAYFDATRGQLETNYKGTDQEEAAKAFLNTSEDFDNNRGNNGLKDKKTAQTFQAKWEMLVGSKVLSPTEANNYIDLFSGQLDKLDILFDASVQIHGTSKTKELLNMFTGYTDKKKATEMVTQISLTKTDPAQFDAIMETLKGIQALDGVTINMELLLTSLGLEGLEVLKSQMEEIEKLKEASAKKGEKKMDLDAVSALGPTQKSLIEELKSNQERMGQFNNLSLEQQAEYLQKLQTQFANESMLTETEKTLQAEKFARQQAMMAQAAGLIAMGTAAFDKAMEGFKSDYLKMTPEEAAIAKLKPIYATGVTSLGAKDVAAPTDGGAKENPLEFLDSLAMRIKMVRDQAFNARKPVESMLAAFNSPAAKKNVANMFKMFDGLQQKLIALKVPKEFRDYIASLSAEDFEKLRKADLDKKAKGQQTFFEYGAKRDKNGKIIKDKNGKIAYDMSKIVGISNPGDAIMAAYNEAPLDNFNIAQKEIIENTDNQFKAFNKLKAQEVDTAVALETVQDATLAAAIASSQLAGTDLKIFVQDLKNAASASEKAAVMADLLKKNAEFKFKSESVPKLAAALKQTGMSVENIQTVLQDPALAKQLIADLEDGKIDSKAIADYLNSIKDEKIVEIRGKFNAGDFAGAAAPGMELVNKMFSVQEQLIRTGVSKASSAMVANVKKLKAVNEEYQLLIQEISFNQIRPIEKAIEKAQRDLEVNIVRKIEDYQEQVNDLQRIIEIAFERPIAAINAENTILSNDMEIMNHAAEEINKRYDEQAEALSKVAEVNAQIVEQEKEQLDLADALSKGDIAAAARAVQSIRAAQSARNAENASKALEQSRKNKLDNLKGKESGLTRDQITERQYQNAQAVYELENKATTDVNGKLLTRLEILDQIQKKSDEIYNLEEKREAAQLAIRDKEDQIYKIKQEQIAPLEDTIEKNNVLIARDEYNIQKLVDGITVLGKTKDAWDGIQAKIDSSALAGEDFDRLMGSMLASTDQIEAGWAKIESTFAKYSSATAAAAGSAMDTMRKQLNEELATNEKIAKEKAEQAKAAQEAAQKEYEIKKAAYEAELKAIEELRKMGDGGLANARLAKLGAAPVAPVFGPTEAADNANVNYNDLSKNAAEDMYAAALKAGKGPVTSSAGGTYVAPSGTGGSSTNGSTTVPGPGGTSTTGTQTTTTTTTNSGTQTVTPTVVPGVKAGTAMSPEDRGVLATATDDRMNKLKQIASNKVVFALNQLKSKYGTNDKNSDTYKNLTGAKRTAFDIDYKNYETRQKEFDEWNKHPSGSGTSGAIDAGYSVAGLKARSELLKELPQWVQDAVAVIDRRQELRNKDLLPFLEIQKKFYAAKDELKIGSNWSFKEIENYKPFMDKYSDVFYKYKEMTANIKSRNEATDLARQNLLKAGYNLSNLGWAFESGQKNSGVGGPFHDSTPKGFMASQSYSYYSSGGSVASRFGQKGISLGTDTIPAMLTPGEFVMSRYAVKSHGIGKMQAINSGSSIGDSVYNYSVNVNVKSDSNPDEIARTVIAQIKSIDSQRIRGVRS